MKRGIYLVANFKSQEMCANLIYSIRESGCTLPIRVIHFGGKEIISLYILKQAELVRYEQFTEEAKQFIAILRSVITECPLGFLYRFLGFFLDWDEFIYSDNDIVALCNWDEMFAYLNENDLVHADEEYTTKGRFNYNQPDQVKALFGESALETAITAGHIIVRRSDKMITDIKEAVNWFKEHPAIPKKHDQSLLHIASLLGNWKVLNLCRPPYNWISSWSGDYKNSLQLIHEIQCKGNKISHIHYSGYPPTGNQAIQELLFSAKNNKNRLIKLSLIGLRDLSGFENLKHNYNRIVRFFKKKLRRNKINNNLFLLSKN